MLIGCDFNNENSKEIDISHIQGYEPGDILIGKPVIYLYPNEEEQLSVKLNYKGEFTCTYPKYDNGWDVIANPDGTLINLKDNRKYSYLYWEGTSDVEWGGTEIK